MSLGWRKHVGTRVAGWNAGSNLWDIYGTITEIGPFRRYRVKTQAGGLLVRNRKFLKRRNSMSVFPGSRNTETEAQEQASKTRPKRTHRKPARLIEDPDWPWWQDQAISRVNILKGRCNGSIYLNSNIQMFIISSLSRVWESQFTLYSEHSPIFLSNTSVRKRKLNIWHCLFFWQTNATAWMWSKFTHSWKFFRIYSRNLKRTEQFWLDASL